MRPSEALYRHREEVLEIIGRYPVRNPRIFGSVARGEDTEESDLDILVDLLPTDERRGNFTLYDLVRLQQEITAATGTRTDIRTDGDFSPRVFRRIERSLKAL